MALTEAQQLLKALEEEGYVLARVARALGVTNATVANRVKKHHLDELVESKNARLRAHRVNRLYPPAPHEPSRQAQEQRRNREAGLCGCGRPRTRLDSGKMGKSCDVCRSRDRERKQAGGAARAAERARNIAAGRCECGGRFAPMAGSDRRSCVGCGALSPSRRSAER